MISRSQYRCSFKTLISEVPLDDILERCKEAIAENIRLGKLCNVSFYRYKDMGFLYVEEIVNENVTTKLGSIGLDNDDGNINYGNNYTNLDIDVLMSDLKPYLKPWPEEEGDRYFVPMINVYYHHIPEENIDKWEYERTTAQKERIGRVAFVYPDKMTSYIMHHTAIVNEGLLKGDKYAFISMHENLLFSYYEEPRNNVNIKDSDEESTVIKAWMDVDPESHFDREKAKGSNFLVIPCLFTIDRLDVRG